LSLVLFITPFYPNSCSEKKLAPSPSLEEKSTSDATHSSTSSDSLDAGTSDEESDLESPNESSNVDPTKQANDRSDDNNGFLNILFGDGSYMNGFDCVAFGFQPYASEYGIITAFLFLLICLLLKNIYERRKFIIIVLLELTSLPLLYVTNFDIFLMKAVPGVKLWGFWACFTIIAIMTIVDVLIICKNWRK